MNLILLSSCKHKATPMSVEDYYQVQGHMVNVNRMLVKKDSLRIVAYIDRQKLAMHETGTGLWYMINKEGKGDKAVKGEIATINYRVTLLDGTFCYDSKTEGPKTFQIGKGGIESGLEEGILLLKEGSQAKFILPPHLAYGLLGDQKKIPKRAILIYDVEVLSLRKY